METLHNDKSSVAPFEFVKNFDLLLIDAKAGSGNINVSSICKQTHRFRYEGISEVLFFNDPSIHRYKHLLYSRTSD